MLHDRSKTIKASNCLSFARVDGALVGYNFISKNTFECSPDIFELLDGFDDWKWVSQKDISDITPLIEMGVLIEQGTESHKIEEQFSSKWHWGIPSAMFHFSLHDREMLDIEYNQKYQQQKSVTDPSPPLYSTNFEFDHVTKLSMPDVNKRVDLLQVMSKRRTVRGTPDGPIPLSAVSDMLYSSMAIIDFVDGPAGRLPLKMTPSGGARNPYEAYIFSRNISDLENGVYHYSAFEHNLAKIADMPPSLAELAGGQEWVEDKACLIVLCAHLERTMWKYEDPNAYRVVLIEAGHIAQNMMLMGTAHGVTACPTGALSQSKILDSIGYSDGLLVTPLYAVALGKII